MTLTPTMCGRGRCEPHTRPALSRFYAWTQKKKGSATNPAEEVELSRYYRPPPVVIARPEGKKTKAYPIVGAVREAYDHWLRLRRHIIPYNGHEDYVFIHPHTGYRISRQRAWHRLQRLAGEAGLPPDVVDLFSPHKLRHSRARAMLDSGNTLADVQAACDQWID